MSLNKRDILSAADLGRGELENLLELAQRTKGKRQSQVLAGRTLGLLFFDRSLRTRVSFEVAATQLGAHCLNIFADREIYDLEQVEQALEHLNDEQQAIVIQGLRLYASALGKSRLQLDYTIRPIQKQDNM